MNAAWRRLAGVPRFMPLVGVAVGALAGAVYWIGAQIWPTSIAVVLSMIATTLVFAESGPDTGARTTSLGMAGYVFAVLVKYNALMALSAANLPYRLPANLALGLIMIAGQACSRALVVSVLATATRPASKPAAHGDSVARGDSASHVDLGIALAVGFAPAALIGLPGLFGLVAAIIARIVFIAAIRRNRPSVTAAELDMTQQLTEVCFYLAALAGWAYV
jgi:adenosylcobinamide-GDP ribazoletransferase